MKLFYKWTKIFDKLFKSLNFLFLFSYRHILFAHYLLKKNSSWLIFELIKVLEIKASMPFNLEFANNTILSCFFLFFLIINLYFLIPAATAQFFNPIA